MPRSFLVKKSLKGEDAGYHSYRVREAYDHDVLDVSLKAVTPYTPYTPPALPAAAVPLTVRVNNGEFSFFLFVLVCFSLLLILVLSVLKKLDNGITFCHFVSSLLFSLLFNQSINQ